MCNMNFGQDLELSSKHMRRGTIILICGKIASGKSFYAEKLMRERSAILFSMDELFEICKLDFFNDEHNKLYPRIQRYLYEKAAALTEFGIDVIMDSGFWSKQERKYVTHVLNQLKVPFEWHYIDISDNDWDRNIQERNNDVATAGVSQFLIDSHKKQEINAEFETPDQDEIDVWIYNCRGD